MSNKIGYSRIGRILFSKERKLYIATPNLIIPIKSVLMKQFSFIQEFENHDLFSISKEFFLKIGFIREKFKNTGFVFTYPGSIQEFQEILKKNLKVFSEDNIISLIPFNVPTTSISKEFALKEIKNYIFNAEKILNLYPNLNFGISIKIFEYTELFDSFFPLIKDFKNIKIVNLADIFDNFNNFRNLLKIISTLKKELNNNIIIIASGRIIPKYYPLLIYLGIDLIDCSYSLFLSAENFYDTIEYLLPIYKVKYLPCSCVACKGNLNNVLDNKHSIEKIELLSLHNLIIANNYMRKIKQYLNYEDFRAFVEKSSFDDTKLISILKILDKEYFHFIKFETPIMQKNKKIRCLGPSSYNRPDFQQFRERTIKNFEPESWTTLIILLPCSAKKPYSQSKSHKLFYKVIRKFSEFPNFQEFILTSPLGVIPRQLENVYPVNSYDISVTGEWDNEEINITAEMLIKILEKYDNGIPILCHLKPEYLESVNRASKKLPHKFIFSEIQDKTTSIESLNSLENLIKEYKNAFKPKKNNLNLEYFSKTWIRKFVKILDYQFGISSGIRIISNGLSPIRIKSNEKIDLIDLKTKEKLGIFKYSTGQIDLTLTGLNKLAQSLHSINSNYIVFDGEEIKGNTLFRAGILDYSADLIPSNQVIILNKGRRKIIGIGELVVGSNFLRNSKSGRIVKINESK
ncbi:MAG: DUF5591 domain-containing protein [Promethearchaeota archaeon]|nr:MAG: DUF5591 domain-containing protein [Candidatus Lokiarchaeota archaeon]